MPHSVYRRSARYNIHATHYCRCVGISDALLVSRNGFTRSNRILVMLPFGRKTCHRFSAKRRVYDILLCQLFLS